MECRRGLAMRILSVRLFVCPSVKRVNYEKTEERSVQIFKPYERLFSLFSEKKSGWWGRPLLREILGQPAPVGAIEIADFEPIIARSPSAVTPIAKKVQLTLTGNPLFYALSNEPKVIIVRCPEVPKSRRGGGLKKAKRPISI